MMIPKSRPDPTASESVPSSTDRPQPVPSLPAAQSDAVDVSVLIVSWNSEPWIARCLESVSAATGSLDAEVFVWDNASGDASASVAAAAASERTEVIASVVNRGFAGAINDLVPRLRGRYVFLLNPDCAPLPGSIETLVSFLDRTGVAGAAPLLLGDDGRAQREFQLRRFPTLRSILADALLFEKIVPSNRASRHYRYRDLDITAAQPIEQPAAAALMIRREVMEGVGPFDERFLPAWFEDVDYCRRIWQAGHRLHLVPEARAVHSGGSSLEILGFEAFLSLWYRNLFRYAEKWLKPAESETIRWGIMGGMLLRIGASAFGLHREPVSRRAAMRAYRGVLSQAWRRWDATSRSS